MKCKPVLFFILGILIIVVELWTIYATMKMASSKYTLGISIFAVHWANHAYNYCCLFVGFAVCHYAITGSEKTYKLIMGFLLLAAFYQVIAFIKDPSQEQTEADIKLVSEKLRGMMPNYDWSGNDLNTTKTTSTEVWNYIQGFIQCCGVDSANDWNMYRPEGLASNLYPSSCCMFKTSENYCDTTLIQGEGCIPKINYLQSKTPTFRLILIAFYLIVTGCMGYSLRKKNANF